MLQCQFGRWRLHCLSSWSSSICSLTSLHWLVMSQLFRRMRHLHRNNIHYLSYRYAHHVVLFQSFFLVCSAGILFFVYFFCVTVVTVLFSLFSFFFVTVIIVPTLCFKVAFVTTYLACVSECKALAKRMGFATLAVYISSFTPPFFFVLLMSLSSVFFSGVDFYIKF